jgi:hypothetical protein
MITSFMIRDIEGRGTCLEPTKTRVPATITQAEIRSPDLGAAPVVPALIADLGYDAS